MIKTIILILIIIFLVINYRKTELYSNADTEFKYQDTELLSKFKIYGTNITVEKPLLTLYYDRTEPNCKYFYDYFSLNFGGLDNSGTPFHSMRFKMKYNSLERVNLGINLNHCTQEMNIILSMINFLPEEIEVDQYNISNFNSLPAFRIDNTGQIETMAESKKEYGQYYRDSNFVP